MIDAIALFYKMSFFLTTKHTENLSFGIKVVFYPKSWIDGSKKYSIFLLPDFRLKLKISSLFTITRHVGLAAFSVTIGITLLGWGPLVGDCTIVL